MKLARVPPVATTTDAVCVGEGVTIMLPLMPALAYCSDANRYNPGAGLR